MTHVPTGQYAAQTIDICPKKNTSTTLPPFGHIQGFFSQFGSILTVYYHDNSHKPTKRDHAFIVFENERAVVNVSNYFARGDTSGFWKELCNIGYGVKYCPAAMMAQILSITRGAYGYFPKPRQTDQNASSSKSKPSVVNEEPPRTSQLQNLKRDRDQSSAADITSEPSKRVKSSIDNTGSSFDNRSTLPSHTYPLRSRANVNANREISSHAPSTQRGTFGFSQPSNHHDNGLSVSVPELAGATKLIENASPINTMASALETETEKLRADFEQMKFQRDKVKSERDRLLVERDEARTEAQKYRVERDEARVESEIHRTERDKAIDQCEVEAEICHKLRKQIEGLENALREKDENSRQVLNLMIASLQARSTADQPGSSSVAHG